MNEVNMPDSKPWALTTVYGYVYLVGAMTFVVVYQTSRLKTKENSGWKGLVPSPQLASGLVAILSSQRATAATAARSGLPIPRPPRSCRPGKISVLPLLAERPTWLITTTTTGAYVREQVELSRGVVVPQLVALEEHAQLAGAWSAGRT